MYIDRTRSIVDVFREFNSEAHHPFPYPPDNITIFEEWYYQQYCAVNARERVYLPIFWTGFYVRHKFGKSVQAIEHLQGYLNALDTTRKYYTICQYDDGILNDISHLDLKVYSMSGQPMDYPLPLICQPHSFQFTEERDLLMSFVGANNHPIRDQLIRNYGKLPGSYVSSERHSLRDYCKILARSKFALCPRGYGPTSFRIMEALQYGAIPVYISDNFIMPHSRNFPSILIGAQETKVLANLPEALSSFKEPIEQIQQAIPKAFKKLFTYEATRDLILENLLHEDPGQIRSQGN